MTSADSNIKQNLRQVKQSEREMQRKIYASNVAAKKFMRMNDKNGT